MKTYLFPVALGASQYNVCHRGNCELSLQLQRRTVLSTRWKEGMLNRCKFFRQTPLFCNQSILMGFGEKHYFTPL